MLAPIELHRLRAILASFAAVMLPAIVATLLASMGKDVTILGMALSFGATFALSGLLFALFQVPLLYVLHRFWVLSFVTLLPVGAVGGLCAAFALSLPNAPSSEFLLVELGMGSLSGATFWIVAKIPLPLLRQSARSLP